ncbi:hypothetical protein I6N90_05185 [Paenibacillus sp. GSMTC-2017]|uniref:hypothetical protein n=1 Tax=Paenibacillus sp. GSMTC-2017 TaxID=2794350 RepID=UPI0018D5B99D|nr:hypothetical protein [Paenibacillus sp. GSMTC-2017]MBH5317202.1 hypothetical protein [Paenibacillus sp. GSMTC-2017]
MIKLFKRCASLMLITAVLVTLLPINHVTASSVQPKFSTEANNRLANSNFDIYDSSNALATGWVQESWGGKRVSFEKHLSGTGTLAQKIVGNGINKNGYVGVSQGIQVQPNKAFFVSGRFNVEELTNAKVELYVDFYGQGGAHLGVNITEQTVISGANITLSNQGVIPLGTTIAKVHAIVRSIGDNGSGTFYVDAMNFSYSSTAQLLSNDSFDINTGTNGTSDGWVQEKWGANGASFEVIQSATGTRAQKIVASGISSNGIVGVSQLIQVQPNKPFLVSGRMNVEFLTNAKVQLYIDFYSKENRITGSNVTEQLEISGGNITLSNQGIIPEETTHARIHVLVRAISDGGTGTIYVDEINLFYGENNQLLSNNGFDTYTGTNGIADGWVQEKWSAKVSSSELVQLATGSRAQKFEGHEISSNGTIGMSQVIKVEPNKPFSIDGRMNVESLKNAKVQLYVDFYRGGNYIKGITITEKSVISRGYISFSKQGDIPAGTTSAKVYVLVRATSDGGSGTFYLEDINFSYGKDNQPQVKNIQLLENNNFDIYTGTNGIADGWVQEKWGANVASYQVVPSATGSLVQKIVGSEISSNGIVGVSQYIKVEPNKPFTINGTINIESLTKAKVQIYVAFFKEGNKNTGGNLTEETWISGGNYTVSNRGIVPAESTYAVVYVNVKATSDGGSGTLYVDELSFSYGKNNQLLSNSNFDAYTGTTGAAADGWFGGKWGAKNAAFEIAQSATGSRVQKIVGSEINSNGIVGVSQAIRIEPNKPFTFNGTINIESLTNAKVQLYVAFYKDGNQYTGGNLIEETWISGGNYTVSNQGVVPADSTYAVVYANVKATSDGGSGTFYVDELNLSYSENSQLLGNHSFDGYTGTTGSADSWLGSKWGAKNSSFSIVHLASGSRVQKVVGSEIGSNGIVGMSQAIRVEPNKPFTISGRMNVESLTDAKIQLYVAFFKDGNQQTGGNLTEQDWISGGYMTLSNQGIVPVDSTYAVVYANLKGIRDGAAGTFYLDEINLSYGDRSSELYDAGFENSLENSALAGGWEVSNKGDEISLITSKEDAVLNRTVYTYDSAGKIVSSSLFNKESNTHIGYKYDLNGNLLKRMKLVETVASKRVHEGSRAQKIVGWWIENGHYRGIAQTVKVEPGKAFNLNAAVNILSLRHAKVQMQVDYYNSSNQMVGTKVVDAAATTNGEYKNITIQDKTPLSAVYARVSVNLRAIAKDGAGIFYVDSVNFKYEQ